MINKNEELGEVEVEIKELKVLNEAVTPVFEISNDYWK